MKYGDTSAYIHPEGWLFIGLFALLAILLSFVGGPLLVLGLILLGWCVYFFRNPPRTTPTRPGLIVSPADGKVVAVEQVKPDAGLGLGDETRWRISIFLNVFDVHVNRAPIDGEVVHMQYRPGKFLNASLDKASVDNERMAIALQLTGDHPYTGKKIGVVQIAGLIARRIVCNTEMGQKLRGGERYGIIRFGSRTDVYLPVGLQPLVMVGQYMMGGETVLADCLSEEEARTGEVR